MNVNITTAVLNEMDLGAGDEIGVFDGDICVGVGVLDDILSNSNILAINTSAQDNSSAGTNGFVGGNTISYKFYDSSESWEVDPDSIVPQYVQGEGVFSNSGSAYAILTAEASSYPIAPELFQFEQSTLQAFYFFNRVVWSIFCTSLS